MAGVVDVALELTSHLEQRMEERGVAEAELRDMFHRASSIRRDIVSRRWRVAVRYRGSSWTVIVEPDFAERVLVVVTLFQTHGETR